MRKLSLFFFIMLLLPLLLVGFQPTHAAATITVSGTVTGPGGPVANVSVGVGSPLDYQSTLTNSSGQYSLSIQTDGQLWVNVRPDVATRLTQANFHYENVTNSFALDVSLVNGQLISLRPLGNGQPLSPEWLWFELFPMNPAGGEGAYQLDWYENSQRFEAVLPPDIYHVRTRHVPDGYYQTQRSFDLRTADVTADFPLNTSYEPPYPHDPPDMSKISLGTPTAAGQLTVTGAAGAALPLAHVMLVNLNTAHQHDVVSAADGSFSTQIFAPAGSAVMIKHGPPDYRWSDLDVGVAEMLNPLPGTIFHVPFSHTAGENQLAFATAGAIELTADDEPSTPNLVNASWSLTGTVGPVVVEGEWTRVLTGTYDSQVVPGLYLGGLNWTHPTLADLDNDNDPDLLVGADPARLIFYRNEGSVSNPDWQFETDTFANITPPAHENWAYPALADVTNDGAPDLFVGWGSGSVSIYYNQGTAASPIWPTTADLVLAAANGASPALNDLDGDSDLDLLIGGSEGTLHHYKNSGTASTPAWSLQTTTYASISEASGSLQPAFIDLDDDGDQDLLLGLDGQFVWYQRGGTANAPTWSRQTSDPLGHGGGSSASSAGVADWNNDTRPDVITGEHWGNLRFFDSSGSQTWSETDRQIPFELLGDTAPAVGDWNNDNLPDLLIGQVHGNVEQYTNTGTAALPGWRPDGTLLTLPWTDHPRPYPTFVDIDNDDDLDLFIGEGGWQSESGAGGNIHYYRNDGTPTVPDWNLQTDSFLSLDVGGWSRPVFADIDNDNDYDLFIGAEDGTLTYVENTGTAAAPTWATPTANYGSFDFGDHSAPAFLDLDLDNDLDLFVGLANGRLAYVRNSGTVSAPSWELVTTAYPGIEVGSMAAPTAADLSGDGRPDLLIGDGDGGLNLYVYAGTGQTTPPPDVYQPGDLIHIAGTMSLHSDAITLATDLNNLQVNGHLNLLMLADANGHPRAAENYFMSTMLTPSGLPIQHPTRSYIDTDIDIELTNLQVAANGRITGELNVAGELPATLPDGLYRPVISFWFQNVPSGSGDVAANVVRYTFEPHMATLPPLTVGTIDTPRLAWQLLTNQYAQGVRGTSAREDRDLFGLTTQIVTQDAVFYLPRVDPYSGDPLTYRLEPFLPRISFTDRRMPMPPLIPFDLPGGQLCVTVQTPDLSTDDLGCASFAQSLNRTNTTRDGNDLNSGTVQLNDVYALQTAAEQFAITFAEYGHHVIEMSGYVDDVWGNRYEGGGTYDVWVAEPLDFDPGVLPGTPLAAGDAFNPALSFYPPVPAEVEITLTHYPDSDPAQMETYTISGQANDYGYFSTATTPVRLQETGEFRVDMVAQYTAADGTLYMGTMSWGSIVMTPANQATLVAHGRRGIDTLTSIPNHWFVASRDLTIPAGAISHTFNPYFNGDILWSRLSDGPVGGDSLLMGASVQDTVGTIEAAVQSRANRMNTPLAAPGDLNERFSNGEIPLFSSTLSGRPVQLELGRIGTNIPADVDQIAYSYRSSQRPGVRVREIVAEDGQTGGYWRLNTLYDDQFGVGILGDQENDFKFQYVGAVYRDLQSGVNEYVGQGSGWVFIPDDDPLGSRVMPPFAGPGNGGWTTEGGPIMTLNGEEIHIFIYPTGVAPGQILTVGDQFHFAGHIMPTLNSQVDVTVTAPGGDQHTIAGQANQIGYFYDPAADFAVTEPGLWTVDVQVWHDGQTSGGATVSPYPSGDVLGSSSGRYWFYVVPVEATPLPIPSPAAGQLTFPPNDGIAPLTITGLAPAGVTNGMVDYTINMPGFILAHGQATVANGRFEILFDPAALQQTFPNLDLIGRTGYQAGLSDTITVDILLSGSQGSSTIFKAQTVTIQGDFLHVMSGDAVTMIYLPLVATSP